MDRLAEQVVAWHNRHPLAKRITVYDVHTIGVVALPFMRSGGSAASADPVEPVLTDVVSPESLAAWGENESAPAVHPNAAHLDALADQNLPPVSAGTALRERLRGLAFWRRGKKSVSLQAWPAFSEPFVGRLSPRRIANFAKSYGYTTRPGDASWPQRVVPIDDAMMAAGSAAGGSWPFELYLMSAAIDAGSSRTRVLAGHGRSPVLLGKRCLSPVRLGLLALVLLGLAGGAAVLWWPHGPPPAEQAAVVVEAAPWPASAASAPPPMASAPEAPAASAVMAEPLPASAPERAASAPEPASVPSIEAPPSIRPQIALPARPARASEATAERPAEARPAEKAADPVAMPTVIKPAGKAVEQALSGKPVVALVGPISPNKADAEALLERMRKLIAPTQADPKALQGQIFQTPEGWRAAVWPFASREEAQLINATLVARGMRTRAVDF